MELNVNFLVSEDQQITPADMSGSIATHGSNAGRETWQNSLDVANGRRVKGFDLASAKAWAKEFGAWEAGEIEGWSRKVTLALVLQYIAGDINEAQSVCPGDGLAGIDWKEYEALSERGTCSGTLFVHEGELWASISN